MSKVIGKITNDDMAIVYMSPDPFFDSFEEELDLRKWSFDKHHTAGLSLIFILAACTLVV